MSLQLRRRPSVCIPRPCAEGLRPGSASSRSRAGPCSPLTPIDFAATITSPPVAMNGALYFGATDAAHGDELWRSDGTAAGTSLVKDIRPGAASPARAASRSWATPSSSRPTTGPTASSCGRPTAPPPAPPWSRTSTAGPCGSYPQNLANVNGTLFFQAYDASGGYELLKSDGTAAGTGMVKDIYPGGTGSYPANLTAVGQHLLLRGQRRDPRHRAVEERRHRRRHRPGQGHQPRHGQLLAVGPDERRRDALLHGQRRRPTASSCGRATARPPAPSWSRTSARGPAAPSRRS